MVYPVQPVEQPQIPIIINSVDISVRQVILGVSATVEVKLFNSADRIIDMKHLYLKQPEYSEWGSDDNFIVNWVFTQLGFSPPSV